MNKLGELRQFGRVVEQAVLNAPHCTISYMFWPERGGHIGKMIEVRGSAPIPPGLGSDAENVMRTRRHELVSMLSAAQHGPFYADRTGHVIADLRDEKGAEIHVFYIGLGINDFVVSSTRPNVPIDRANQIAREEWAAVPEDTRKRLMSIARPWGSQS